LVVCDDLSLLLSLLSFAFLSFLLLCLNGLQLFSLLDIAALAAFPSPPAEMLKAKKMRKFLLHYLIKSSLLSPLLPSPLLYLIAIPFLSHNQSIKQSINKSINQSINLPQPGQAFTLLFSFFQ
jgi:hypothetical protein